MTFNMQHGGVPLKNHLPFKTRMPPTQKNLIVEEFKEFLEEEATDGLRRFGRMKWLFKRTADLVYVCFQYASRQEWDLDQALIRVHDSNLSKLGDDGQPIYREDGKVLKGPNYQPPDLTDLI